MIMNEYVPHLLTVAWRKKRSPAWCSARGTNLEFNKHGQNVLGSAHRLIQFSRKGRAVKTAYTFNIRFCTV